MLIERARGLRSLPALRHRDIAAIVLVACLAAGTGFAASVPLPVRPIRSVQIGGWYAVPVPIASLHFWFDDFGAATTGIGDLDGDGVADVLVGAPSGRNLGTGGGAAIVIFLERDGGVKAARAIDGSGGPGNLSSPLQDADRFGAAVAAVGDLDGDGVRDVVVGAPGDDDAGEDAGALYVLFLQTSGAVKAEKKIASGVAGFTGVVSSGAGFGASVVTFRGQSTGSVEIAVGAPGYSSGNGAVWVLSLDATGEVTAHRELRADDGGISPAPPIGVLFGSAVAVPDDVDGNGIDDILVGAPLYISPTKPPSVYGPGAAWLLLRDGAGGIESSVRIGENSGGFAWDLADFAGFGSAAATVGDLDGDGITDVAVAAPGEETIWFLLLDASGTVRETRRMNATSFPPGQPHPVGTAIGPIGDLDGNGVADLVIGGDRYYDDYPATTTTTFFCGPSSSTTTSSTTSTTLIATPEAAVCIGPSPARRASASTRRDTTPRVCSFVDGVDKCDRAKSRRCGDEHVLVAFLDYEADPATCGDGVIHPGETCDDGNSVGGDCCSADCLVAPTGNECRFDGNPCGDHFCNGQGACVLVPTHGACVDYFACVDRGTCVAGACVSDDTPRGLCRVEDGSCRACGQPITAPTEPPSAADALAILQAAVGLADCLECVCDINGSYAITATDAYFALRRAVELGLLTRCPHR